MPRRHKPTTHDRYTHTAPCSKKRRFKTEADALQAIESAELRNMSLELKTYECPYCGTWHLSSKKDQ